jgi:S1-C subfamily serine protease
VVKSTIKKTLRNIILGVSALFLAVSGPEMHQYYLRHTVGKSVVQISPNGKGGGSGFSMEGASGELYIVTNEHVCSPSLDGYVYIKSDRGFTSRKEIVHIDTIHDICLVKGDKRIPALDLASKPSKGDTHFVIGHPGGRKLTISKGEYIGNDVIELLDMSAKTVAECKGRVIELNFFEQMMYGMQFVCLKSMKTYASSAIAYGGNSGSPAVNVWGNVMGILFAGSREQNTDNHLVPLEELKRVISQF